MSRIKLAPILIAATLIALAGNAGAQEISKSESAKPQPDVMLRVQLVIARFQGDRKLASLPYTLVVNTGDQASMRMGLNTPVPATVAAAGSTAASTVSYRSVGTNIDCYANGRADGRYRLAITVQNSSALQDPGSKVEGAAPIFREFSTTVALVLGDGQSIQTIASTDPVTGEVVKIDVTLNVVR